MDKLTFIPHHLAHAYSTYYSSDFNESLIVVADAMGSEIIPGGKAESWFSSKYDVVDTSNEEFNYSEGITIFEAKGMNL